MSGTIGLGIGFGLQNIADNFFSGLIILFERPVKVGDRIQVGEINGDVVRIAIRSTTILTNGNLNIIIPNSEFVSKQVINWSHNDRSLRVSVPVGVSCGSDPELVKRVLPGVAGNPDILTKPAPAVLFSDFGDSALDFELLLCEALDIYNGAYQQMSELGAARFAGRLCPGRPAR